MTARLPQRDEAQQLRRLRSLRVQRARSACAAAAAQVERAAQAVRGRQALIERGRGALDALGRAVVNELAPRLPRWSHIALAERERLADRLERDEFALVGDEQALEQALEQAQQARAELSRALAREDAVAGLVRDTHRAHSRALEQRAERDLEDLARGVPR